MSLAYSDRKSTRLNSSHLVISYAVFCLKKKKKHGPQHTWRKRTLVRPIEVDVASVRRSRNPHGAHKTCSHINTNVVLFFFFFFNDTATTEIYTLSLHDALPI